MSLCRGALFRQWAKEFPAEKHAQAKSESDYRTRTKHLDGLFQRVCVESTRLLQFLVHMIAT